MSYKDRAQEKAHGKAYYAAHREERAIYNKAYRISHREEQLHRQRVYAFIHRQEQASKARAWYAANKERARSGKVKKAYNLSPTEHISLLNKQTGRCGNRGCGNKVFICGKGSPIDHDHIIEQTRGILCSNCNRALGLLKDSIFAIRGLAAYLRRANIWYEKDMPEKLKQMSAEQAQLDSLDREEQRAN
jgi:hypothetical protein